MGRRANIKLFLAPEGESYCCKCDSYKKLKEFSDNKSSFNGKNWYCKLCVRKGDQKYKSERALTDKERNYGISAKDYLDTLEKQNHVCAICGKPETKMVKGSLATLSVDHDHGTGKIRGLLCSTCNSGIGAFMDDAELMSRAIEYLNQNQVKPKSKKVSNHQVENTKMQSDLLQRMIRGLPKQLTGGTDDIECLPLFSFLTDSN